MTELKFEMEEALLGGLASFLAPRAGQESVTRSGGLHVSDIVRELVDKGTKPGSRPAPRDMSPEERKRMGRYATMGLIWEHVVARVLASFYYDLGGRYIPTGEMHLDGITGTPDALDTIDWAIEEFKATWRSSRRPLDPDFWPWLVQIRAYCKMANTRCAYLRVFYVNGDYRESGPQIKAFALGFEGREIEENWSMLVNHAKRMGKVKR